MEQVNDNILSDFLLKEIAISHNNKVLRTGRLLLFSIKDFYFHFTLNINNNTKHFEIPYPFQISRIDNDLFLLDFTLSAFKAEYSDVERKIKNIGNKKRSRYYNSILRLHTT